MTGITSLEICAGGGGQALGLEQAGFQHEGLVEVERHYCNTLRLNRPGWRVFEKDLRDFVDDDAESFRGIDLLAGGLPCPPFSIAGRRLGDRDERNLFPVALDLVDVIRPRAVMIENVRGMLGAVFKDFREQLKTRFQEMGYQTQYRLFNACDFGVPQLRPRVVIVALRADCAHHFSWPSGTDCNPPTVGETAQLSLLSASSARNTPTVGETLYDLIAERGWEGARKWRAQADGIAPTVVGGSLKHGGPDLGPTRARKAWAALGVDGRGIADEPPAPDFIGMPRLTVRMVARIQGFPDDWKFSGGKTASYRQVGNAFPPPVARSIGKEIRHCLSVSGFPQVAGVAG